MAKKRRASKSVEVENYSHSSSSRKNIPPAKIAAEGNIPAVQMARYGYSAHLSPELRFDPSGHSDRVSAIVEKAISGQTLTNEEAEILRGLAGNVSQPWLEWSGKKEEHDRGLLEVDPVALHIHERVSAKAIVRAAKRKDIQRSLFADPEQDYGDAVQFYQHDVDWANRLILGDSLQVMSSLARRENLAGKVQMIYIDPPYGIKFASNFQPEVTRRVVTDKDQDLCRQPEIVKAYRDTWHLGTHSYLSYLRDRLLTAKELLSDTGSIFVQIGDENEHRVRAILDEVFDADNFITVITVKKTAGLSKGLMPEVTDFILWYARDKAVVKRRTLFVPKDLENDAAYSVVELSTGARVSKAQVDFSSDPELRSNILRYQILLAAGRTPSCVYTVSAFGQDFDPTAGRSWSTNPEGMQRLLDSERVVRAGKTLNYVRFGRDNPTNRLQNLWSDTASGSGMDKVYAVQTSAKVIERCVLMSTDPGDLVLDPTCGSGTTAFVAEQWGRRWITIDTARVAVAVARQRLLTAKFDRYRLKGEESSTCTNGDGRGFDPGSDFVYKSAPHVTLASIARNGNLDAVFANHTQVLKERLSDINNTLSHVDDSLRVMLATKLADKMQNDGVRSATDADVRRWLLPGTTRAHIDTAFSGHNRLTARHARAYFDQVPPQEGFEHWQVPFDTDPDWPNELTRAVEEYRISWRAKMDDVNACIDSNAEHETLVDQPEIVRGVVRVSGPFTVEGVRPEELSLDEDGQTFDPTPNGQQSEFGDSRSAQNATAYLDRMRQLISKDGVTFPNNEHRKFLRVDPLDEVDSALHAESIWEEGNDNEPCNVGIAFGPQYGPVTAEQVEDLVRASRRYDELVIAGFSFDGAAQEVIQESANKRLKIHMAHIRPDVSPGMDGLLKDTPESQLFTVFGQPEIEVRSVTNGAEVGLEVELLGVDIYSPLTGEIKSTGAEKVAAWFLDSDYDGRCFCITQAFFPDQNAWEKIAKALGSAADEAAFAAYKGTVSLPFSPGEHHRIAIKVIDPRGNEVMAIRSLKEGE